MHFFYLVSVHTAVSFLTTAPSHWQDDKHSFARVYPQPQRQSPIDHLINQAKTGCSEYDFIAVFDPSYAGRRNMGNVTTLLHLSGRLLLERFVQRLLLFKSLFSEFDGISYKSASRSTSSRDWLLRSGTSLTSS